MEMRLGKVARNAVAGRGSTWMINFIRYKFPTNIELSQKKAFPRFHGKQKYHLTYGSSGESRPIRRDLHRSIE